MTTSGSITCAWQPFLQSQQWPIFDYIEAECDKRGIDARQVVAALPALPLPSVAGFRYGPVWYSSSIPTADTPILLRVIGLYHLGEPFALEIANEFVRVLGYLIERRLAAPYSPFKLNKVTVTNAEIAQQFPGMTPAIMKFLPELLTHEPTTLHGLLAAAEQDAACGAGPPVDRQSLVPLRAKPVRARSRPRCYLDLASLVD